MADGRDVTAAAEEILREAAEAEAATDAAGAADPDAVEIPIAGAEDAGANTDAAAADADAAEADETVAADGADEAPAEPTADEQVASAQAEAREWQDKFVRLHAEWDTYRRRTNEQREEEKKRAAAKLVESLVPVLDDFERSIDYAEKNGEAGLLEGVQKVHQKLVDALVKGGVSVIDPAGEPFNALEAQAVATVPDEEAFDETVREVYQKGYKMGVKVLRPAMVTVTTGGPKRPDPDEAAK